MQFENYQGRNTSTLRSPSIDLAMNTSSEDSKSAWVADLASVVDIAELAEHDLSYDPALRLELARKQSGSYYTPSDVAAFFWNQFFFANELSEPKEVRQFLLRHEFIEPSAGAGALVFALFHKFAQLGVSPRELASIDLKVVDINDRALEFVRRQLEALAARWGIEFKNLTFECGDFCQLKFLEGDQRRVCFGNPPFVKNNTSTSKWKNLFADFVEIALQNVGSAGHVQFILPLSVAFSRDYQNLRTLLRDQGGTVYLSNFDNIPDTLFKSGKPEHTNSNKANSQRCSIVTVVPNHAARVLSSPLIRWVTAERRAVLSKVPKYFDVTTYKFDGQIPRPESAKILNYLAAATADGRLADLCSPQGKYRLYVSSVARNYIGIRDEAESGVHEFRFSTRTEFYVALFTISSDLFYSYWRTVGDGFHVTKSNIERFPLGKQIFQIAGKVLPEVQLMWLRRAKFQKRKMNSGHATYSYDFSEAVPSIVSAL